MACHLIGARPLSEQMLAYCQLDPQEQTSVTVEFKIQHFFIYKNAFENVACEMAGILSRGMS